MAPIRKSADAPDYARPWAALTEKFAFGWEFDFEGPVITDQHLQIRADSALAPASKVAEIRAALRRGDKVKPNIITRDGWLIDGNTTSRAAKLEKRPTMPAIIIDADYGKADDSTRKRMYLLGVAANTRHGVGISRQDLRTALKLAGAGTTLTDSARMAAMLGVTEKTVRDVVAEGRAVERARKLGVDLNGHLPATALSALGRVSDRANDQPMLLLFKLSTDAGLKGTEISTLYKRMSESRSDAGAIAVVEAERTARAKQISEFQAGQKQRPSVAAKLQAKIGFVLQYEGDPSVLAERNPYQVTSHIERIERAIVVLQHVVNAQPQIQEAIEAPVVDSEDDADDVDPDDLVVEGPGGDASGD